MDVTLSNQAQPSDDVLFQIVGSEAVLLDLKSETYFGLDSVGTRIWNLLAQDGRLQRAFEVLQAEYDVEPDVLQQDLLGLVSKLASAGLVSVE